MQRLSCVAPQTIPHRSLSPKNRQFLLLLLLLVVTKNKDGSDNVNEKSYRRSAGGKMNGFLVPFQISEEEKN